MDSQLERLQRALNTAIAGMSAEELNWHQQEKWCAAEVLEHLYLTYTGTVKGFERVVAAGKSLASRPTFGQRWRSMIVVSLGYLPKGRKAPPVAQPRGIPQEKVLTEISPMIGEMDEIITRCEREAGAGARLLDHPMLGPLTARQWRKFHLVHGLHHLEQIRRLRDGSHDRIL
jgi:hypothetical protein